MQFPKEFIEVSIKDMEGSTTITETNPTDITIYTHVDVIARALLSRSFSAMSIELGFAEYLAERGWEPHSPDELEIQRRNAERDAEAERYNRKGE